MHGAAEVDGDGRGRSVQLRSTWVHVREARAHLLMRSQITSRKNRSKPSQTTTPNRPTGFILSDVFRHMQLDHGVG